MQEMKKGNRVGAGKKHFFEGITAEKLLKYATLLGGAILLGRAELPFSTYPLGIAFLTAAGEGIPLILAGLIVSSLIGMENPIPHLCIYLAIGLSKLVFHFLWEPAEGAEARPKKVRSIKAEPKNLFAQWWKKFSALLTQRKKLQIGIALVASLLLSLIRILYGGFRYYDSFAALMTVAVSVIACFFYGFFLERKTRESVLGILSEILLGVSAVYAATALSFSVFSLAMFLSFLFSVLIGRKRGIAYGTLAAILCGSAAHLLSAPAFLFAVLMDRLFCEWKKPGAGIALSCLAGGAWMYYAGGVSDLLAFTPAALLAGAVLTYLSGKADERKNEPITIEDGRIHIAGERCRGANDRFRGISEAFSALSEVFYNLSDRFRRPGTLDLRQICDRSFDRFCPDCPNKTVCWGLEYAETLSTVNALISALHTKGNVGQAQIPESMAHRCGCMEDILTTINRECAKLTGEMLRDNRTEIFAMDYESAADIIKDALEEDDGEYQFDAEAEAKVADYLRDAGISANSVTVYGKRRRQILIRGVGIDNAKVSSEVLRADLSELCGVKFGNPVFELEKNLRTMTLQAKAQISVVGAFHNISAKGEVSGDSVNVFENKKEYYYALISDGMGSGKEAAMTSGLCSVFLEKMLHAGNRAGTSLRMLNNMIRSRCADSTRECSSTIDLVEIDLMRADAVFMKSGAAPSFVIRGNQVNRLQAGTAPIGIIRTLDVSNTSFRLRDGDVILLISDGILQNDPDCVWLSSYLEKVVDLAPEEIVYHIAMHAAAYAGHDDCSAIALKVRGIDEAS